MSKYSPAHYQRGKIEVWDFIADQQLGYLEGNVIKYICRAGHKAHESSLDDLLKAQAYINKLVSITQHVEPSRTSNRLPSGNGPATQPLQQGCGEATEDSDLGRVHGALSSIVSGFR